MNITTASLIYWNIESNETALRRADAAIEDLESRLSEQRKARDFATAQIADLRAGLATITGDPNWTPPTPEAA